MKPLIVLAALALAGCATVPDVPAPSVEVAGPKFPRAQFNCGDKPLPPDPNRKPTGKDGARYENRLAGWGQTCADKLQSTAVGLEGAGQIVGE